MFEDLDRTDWGRLTHAYGGAEAVPGLLRDLAAPDDATREGAGRSLANLLAHQGTRYRASAPAVPFLLEILEASGGRGKAPLTRLILGLATGYRDNLLPFGFDPAVAFAGLEGHDPEALRARDVSGDFDGDPALDALWARDCYEAVAERVDAFAPLTRDEDPEVRMAAVEALAWFPGAAAASLPVVRAAADAAADPVELANATLALGLLGRHDPGRADVPRLLGQLDPDRPEPARVAAALALVAAAGPPAPPEAQAVLLAAVAGARRLESIPWPHPWHVRGPLAQVADALAAARPAPAGPALAALALGAEEAATPARAQLIYALLTLAFPEPTPTALVFDPASPRRPRIVTQDPASLDASQRLAVRAIGRNACWDRVPFVGGDLTDVLWGFGLPSTPSALRAFRGRPPRLRPTPGVLTWTPGLRDSDQPPVGPSGKAGRPVLPRNRAATGVKGLPPIGKAASDLRAVGRQRL